jgi:Tfp pilus assembly protein PilX
MSNSLHSRARRQQGSALIFGLIMLMLMTLLAVSAYHLGSSQTVIVANAQYRNEGIAAAQQTIDTALNSGNFTQNSSAAIVSSSCSTSGIATNNVLCVDSNGDGVNDFTVNLSPNPTCITAAPIPASQLDFKNADDLACASAQQQTFGSAGLTPTGASACANSIWEIAAQAVDNSTSTNVNVVQGASVRIAQTDMAAFCP